MKKYIFTTAAIAMIAGTVTFTSCKKEDTTAPVITITGGNTASHSLNATWTAPSATATDDEDGDLTSSITVSGTVNENLSGTYELTYSVTDAAGNTASEVLTVTVANDAANFSGNYNVADTVAGPLYFAYTQIVTPSTTINGRIGFNKFADYQNNTSIYATISGTVVSLPSQTTGPIGTNNHVHNFVGTGVTVSATDFNISYTDTDQTVSATATGIMWLRHQ